MMKVVKKEIMKRLDAVKIYPISNSKWVSHVQVVSKMVGVIVVKNYKGDLMSTQAQNRWRVCIDCSKLNDSTRKYHFP